MGIGDTVEYRKLDNGGFRVFERYQGRVFTIVDVYTHQGKSLFMLDDGNLAPESFLQLADDTILKTIWKDDLK